MVDSDMVDSLVAEWVFTEAEWECKEFKFVPNKVVTSPATVMMKLEKSCEGNDLFL